MFSLSRASLLGSSASCSYSYSRSLVTPWYCSTSFLPLLDVACGRALLVGLACSGVKRVCCVLRAALRAECCSLRCICLEPFLFWLSWLVCVRPLCLFLVWSPQLSINACLVFSHLSLCGPPLLRRAMHSRTRPSQTVLCMEYGVEDSTASDAPKKRKKKRKPETAATQNPLEKPTPDQTKQPKTPNKKK